MPVIRSLDGLFQKNERKQGRVGRKLGISRGFEERACGNSRDQLKKISEFPGVFKEKSWAILKRHKRGFEDILFPGVLMK